MGSYGETAVGLYGIDVGEMQGNINWEQVKKEGVQFAMLRSGYGAGSMDVQFRKNAEGCAREKIPFGVYWSSYAWTPRMARKEAEFCIETIEEYKLSYPVSFVFDKDSVKYVETKGIAVTKILATEMAEAFCRRIEELGYRPMYYSNKDFLGRMFDESLQKKYALWYAQYEGESHSEKTVIWQYTNKGRIRGIKGEVNENMAY